MKTTLYAPRLINRVYFLQCFFLLSILLATSCSKKDQVVPIYTELDEANSSLNCPDATYPIWTSSPYVLPYPTSREYRVLLSNCSGDHHAEDSPDQFAVDFSMSFGSTIVAARSGTVVVAIDGNPDGGTQDNVMVIAHSDLTYAIYAHLKKDSILFSAGTTVDQGQDIAKSGNTGDTPTPNLHFVITTGSYVYPYQSVPSNFFNTVSNPRSLEQGQFYTAEAY